MDHQCPEWGRCRNCDFHENWRRWREQSPAIRREAFAPLRRLRSAYRAESEAHDLSIRLWLVAREYGDAGPRPKVPRGMPTIPDSDD